MFILRKGNQMRSSKEIAAEIKRLQADGRKVNAYQNEGCTGYDHTANLAALDAEYREAKAAEFAAEWTKDVTAARREAWNAIARTGERNTYKIEQAVGFSLVDLKKAVAAHA